MVDQGVWMRRLLGLCVGVCMIATLLVVPQSASALTRATQTPAPNPDLDKSCGLNILMVLDESGSIGNSGATDDVRKAFKAFTDALKNTSSSMAVAEFSTVARLPQIGSFVPGEYITITDASKAQFDAYIDNGYNPGGSTNWEDALRMGIPNHAPRPDPVVPHLTVLITDGEPNRIIKSNVTPNEYANKVPLAGNEVANANSNTAADRAIANANNIKSQQSHVLAVAVGSGLSSGGSLGRLIKVSGPDVYDGTGTFDISTDDIYREPDFGKLEDALRDAAFQLCAPSVTVEKLVDLTPDPNSADDAVPGVGWDIEGTPSVASGYQWVLPDSTAPQGAVTTQTNGAGFATFQWNTNLPVASGFTATETIQPGFANDRSQTACTYRTPDIADTPLPLDDLDDGAFTVTIPTDAIVTCTLVNVSDPAPSITLEKRTDGQDADAAPGPNIPVGDPVSWDYLVTNTGNTTLSSIVVTDSEVLPSVSPGPSVTCPVTTLAPGDSLVCNATGKSGTRAGGSSFTGQYANDARVDAVDSRGTAVAATDPSHYFATAPGISVEKSTNGLDADTVPGPIVPAGDPVRWQYDISNTGSETLTGVTLDDDQIGDVLAQSGVSCTWTSGVVGTLDPSGTAGDTAVCDLDGVALPGQYVNIASVSGTGSLATVSDSDPSHYYGATVGVAIEKATNGADADSPTGPIIPAGDPVRWTYAVTNTGNLPLLSWSVTDSDIGSVGCPRVALLPGATQTCTANGVAQPGQYANIGTVTASDPLGGQDLTDQDPSHYFGSQPAVSLEKATNGDDADVPTGPFVPVGAPVTWDYVVTNNGNVALTNLVVVDSDLGDITSSCLVTDLPPSASTACSGTASAITGQYTNVAIALALDPFGSVVGDLDPSHYFGAASAITIEKHTNGVDADKAPGVYVPVGDPITWDYIVTNTGNDTISSISVTDDIEGSVTCAFDTLASGETGTCSVTGIAERGPYANLGTVVGRDPVPQVVTDDDPSHYFGYVSEIDIEKSTNGQDADLEPGPYVEVGETVTWTYTVTNPGDLGMGSIVVVDDQGVVPVFAGGDEDGDDILDPGETWVYQGRGTASVGQYANTATVTGVDDFEVPATDQDPSHYFGFAASIAIDKTPDVEIVDLGDPHTFTIRVENTGDSRLADVAVTDPVTPACERDLGDLLPGEVRTYTCDVPAVTVPIVNVAFVEGTALDGSLRTDSDDAFVGPFAVGGTAAIGDTVWSDENGNGVQDAGEKGIANARVTVRFVSGPSSSVVQNAEQVYTTDSNGWYLAVGLVAGVWEAQVDVNSAEGSLTTPGTYTVQLNAGQEFLDADFGFEAALPVTGSDVDAFYRWGIAFLALGALLVLVSVGRRPTE